MPHVTNNAAPNRTRIGWPPRACALALYFGAVPFLAFRPRRRQDPFIAHHYKQAAAIFFLLFATATIFVLVVIGLSYLMVHKRETYEAFHLEPRLLDLTWKLFLCWIVFWCYGAGLALFGSVTPLPITGFLSRRKVVVRGTASVLCLLYAALAVFALFSVRASALTRQDERPGQVYMLYENVDRFPRWLFTAAFYRASKAAIARHGEGSVVVLRLSEETIARALREGRFIFIGSHGRQQGLLLKGGYVPPARVAAMEKNPGLQYVYLTSCDSGAQKEAWESAMAPAEVVTYPRLTTVLEHAAWLWSEAPNVIRQLPDYRLSPPTTSN